MNPHDDTNSNHAHLLWHGALLEDILEDVAGKLVVGHLEDLPNTGSKHPVPVLWCTMLHQI